MATIESVVPEATEPVTQEAVAPTPGAPIRLMAMGLWGVVGTLLAYGVLQTVLKATALFS